MSQDSTEKPKKAFSRRDFLRLTTLTTAGVALAACGADATATPAPTATTAAKPTEVPQPTEAPAPEGRTYEIFHWWPQDNYIEWFAFVGDLFAQKYPGSKVDWIAPGAEYASKIKAGIAAGDVIDAAFHAPNPAQIETWKSGACLDLTDYYAADSEWQRLTDLWPTVPDTQKYYDGRLYGCLWSNNVICIWWWQDLLDEMGVELPETNDDLIAMVPKAADAGLYGLLSAGLGPNSSWHFVVHYFAFESLLDTGSKKLWAAGYTGEGSWLEPELKDAMTLWKDLYEAGIWDPGVLEEDYGSGTNSGKDLFRDKQVAGFYHSGPWMIGYDYPDPDETLKDIRFSFWPTMKAGDPVTMLGSMDMSINVFAVNDDQQSESYKDTMVGLLKLGNSEEAQKLLFEKGITVAWSGALDQPVDTIQKQLIKGHYDLAEDLEPENVVERTLYVAEMEVALVEQMQSIVLGRTNVDDAMDALEDARKRVFSA
jgi:raffinose/stachyose/melibiose transport system substrate-binding protein